MVVEQNKSHDQGVMGAIPAEFFSMFLLSSTSGLS